MDLKEEQYEKTVVKQIHCNMKEEPYSYEDEHKQTILKCANLKDEPNSSDGGREHTFVITNVFSLFE